MLLCCVVCEFDDCDESEDVELGGACGGVGECGGVCGVSFFGGGGGAARVGFYLWYERRRGEKERKGRNRGIRGEIGEIRE